MTTQSVFTPILKVPLSPSGENVYGIMELCRDFPLAPITGMVAVNSQPQGTSLPLAINAEQPVLCFCHKATTAHIKEFLGLGKMGRAHISEMQAIYSAI